MISATDVDGISALLSGVDGISALLFLDGLLAAPVWIGSWPLLASVDGISALMSGVDGISALRFLDGLIAAPVWVRWHFCAPVFGWAPGRSCGWMGSMPLRMLGS